jgi:hypothetical protein
MAAPRAYSEAYPQGLVLTSAQADALGILDGATTPLPPRRVARVDVLWRLTDQGLARESVAGQWSITSRGRQAIGELNDAIREGRGHSR